MGWKTSILILCSMAHYTLQITSQQTYGQMMNKQQIYGQFAGKQPLLAQYSNHLPVLAQYNGNQQPSISQFAQSPSINSFSNQQGSAQLSNQQGSVAQFNNQQGSVAQYSNLQPTAAQYSGQKQLPGQMAFASQLNGKQQQQMLHLQQQQMVGGRLRTRWAGPYKPYYSQIKAQPQLYRPQKQYVTVPNAYGPAYVYKAPKIQNPKFRPTGVKSSEPLMANPAAYAYYAPNSPKAIAQMQQASKLQPSQPYKFVSSPQIKNNAVSAVAPTKSFLSIQQPQTILTSTNPPKILASAPFPVSSNKYFEQYKQNYDGEAKSQTYEQAGSVSQSNQYLSAVKPVRTTVVYPVRGDSDRGPIHTIPAPNLSLADKPIVVPDGNGYGESQQSYFNNQYARPHTYEVTEETKDKVYKNPYSGESKLYAPDPQTSQQNKLSASNYFTNVVKQPFPQDTAFKAQSVTPSLSSQELFRLLNGSPSQQQLADTYNFPLLQQPQLSQHFLQQTLDSNAPLQPFKAIVQPTHGDNANIQQNVLFKPDPKYVQKIQEQYYKPSSDFQPNYHTFNYEEPNTLKGVEALQNELMKTNVEKIIAEDTANGHHTNYIRNTQEGSASNNNNVITDSNTKTKNKTENGSRDFYNHQSGTSFIPSNSPGSDSKESSESSPLTASYFTQVSDPNSGSVSTNYYSSLSDRNVANTLLAVQSANHLINVGNSNAEAKEKSGKDHSEGQKQYFNAMSRNGEYTIESIESDSNSGFTPIKSSPLTVSQEDNKAYDQAPLRIFVSDQYDDIETHSSQNIHVSASLNANQNDFRIYNADDGSNDSSQQDYEDYTQIHKTGNNATSSETERAESDHLAESQANPNNDVVVTLQKNESNPSLDILTKDWKTSIIIKPTEKNNPAGPNLISEYGTRTRPKRD